jgi:hypothetical protein
MDLHKKKVKKITLLDGLFKWKQLQVYVPQEKLCTKVMQEVHDLPIVGHCEEKNMRATLSKIFYWPKMKEVV